jgi:murein DD-endopeptidase MepM/ murein hydrolase activator NlpD
VLAAVAVGGVGTTSVPTHGATTDRLSAALSADAGTTAIGMERDGHRLSRDSARQAMADAGGARDVGSAKTAEATQTSPEIAKLVAKTEKVAKRFAADAWQLPIPGGVYRLTARFGQCSGLWAHCHTGLDFAAPSGTPIHAVANGTISETGWAGAYGNRTVMTLEDGTELWYCHQSEIGVRVGQPVVSGQVIGLVGSTGNTTGPHLHLEVRPGGGDPVDPEDALIAHGVRP